MGRVIVVGWDGATWDLLFPLMERGVLPTLNQIIGESTYGQLRSTIPPVTAPSWISIATGVNPGRHGCFDFNKADGALSKIRPLQSWDIQTRTFYEILEEKNRPFVLINLPGTYPPLTKGITLTSLLTQGDQAVFPEGLKEESEALRNYRVFPDTGLLRRNRLEDYLKDIYDVESKRFDVLKALWVKDWEALFIVFSGGDWVSHELYGELLENRGPKDAEKIFALMDSALSFVLKGMKADDSLIMVSDHGFQKAKGVLHLNEVLCKNGYLVPDYMNPSPPASHKMDEGAFSRDDFKRPPQWILKRGRNSDLIRYSVKAFRKFGGRYPLFLKPDYGKSVASLVTSESYGVTIHEKERFADGSVEPGMVPDLIGRIRDELQSMKRDKEYVFSDVMLREEIYQGEHVGGAPNLVLGDSRWALSSAIRTLEKDPFALCERGIHNGAGIFLGYGRAFSKTKIPNNMLKVEDITPEILYLLDEAVPEGLDGKISLNWLNKDYKAKHPEKRCASVPPKREAKDIEGDEIQRRLKGLGYMS
jgi:predicted AlkP superfamily phosphohydrolase/phosphomutase